MLRTEKARRSRSGFARRWLKRTRRDERRTDFSDSHGRHLSLEPLEDRRLLAHVYHSGDVPNGFLGEPTIVSDLEIPDALSIVDLNVQLSLDHDIDGILSVVLQGPEGPNQIEVELFAANSNGPWNFNQTTFDDDTPTPIGNGTPPFFGAYQPEEPLSAFDGMLAQGVWTLTVTEHWWDPDGIPDPAGELIAWSVEVDDGVPVEPGTIAGIKWDDRDGDQVWDQDEDPLPGWPIFLETMVTVEPDDHPLGSYVVEINAPGFSHPIGHISASGPIGTDVFALESEPPIQGQHVFGNLWGPTWSDYGLRVDLDPQASVSSVSLEFSNPVAASAEFEAYRDSGGGNSLDLFETGPLAAGQSQTMTVRSSGDPISLVEARVTSGLGFFDSLNVFLRVDNQPVAFTNGAGEYTIENVQPGTYAVSEDMPPDWEQTYPGTQSATDGRLFALRGAGGPATAIYEIDPLNGQVVNHFRVPPPWPIDPAVQGLAVGPRSLFCVNGEMGVLIELHPDTGELLDVDVVDENWVSSNDALGVAYLDGHVYLGDPRTGTIHVFDPVSDTTVATLDAQAPVFGLTGAGDRGALYSHLPGFGISEIDPATGDELRRIPLPGNGNESDLAYVDGNLIVAENITPTTFNGVRIDPDDGQVVGAFPMGGVDRLVGLGGDGARTTTAGRHVVTVGEGQTVAGVDFGNRLMDGEILVSKWQDDNGNGQRDDSESPLPSWPIYLDENGNGRLDTQRIVFEPDHFETPGDPFEHPIGSLRSDVTLTTGGVGPVFAFPESDASTGGFVFANESDPSWYGDANELHMEFHQPVTDVAIDFVSEGSSAIGLLRIYDTEDRLLGITTTGELAWDQWERLALSRPTADIAYAIAGSLTDDRGLLDNLTFTVATEPLAWTNENGTWVFGNLPRTEHTVSELLAEGWRQTYPEPPVEATRGEDRLFALRIGDQESYIDEFDADGNLVNSFTTSLANPDWDPYYGLAYGDGRMFMLSLGGQSAEIHEFDPDTGDLVDSDPIFVAGGDMFTGLAYLNGMLYLANDDRLSIMTWDPETDLIVDELPVGRRLWGGLTGAADEGVLYAIDWDGDTIIAAIDPVTGQVLRRMNPDVGGDLLGGLTYFNGELIAAVGIWEPAAVRIDPATGALLGEFPLSGDLPINALGGDGSAPPVTPNARTVSLDNGGVVPVEFGNVLHDAEIRGVKWHDYNGNGEIDAGEPPLEGWQIYLDQNGNGQLDRDIIVVEPDNHEFGDILNRVVEDVVLSTFLGNYDHHVQANYGPFDDLVFGHGEGVNWHGGYLRMDFAGGAQAVSIDFIADQDGARGLLEVFDVRGVSLGTFETEPLNTEDQRTMTIRDTGGNIAYALARSAGSGFLDHLVIVTGDSELSTLTDAQGNYVIAGLPSGDYRVSEVVPDHWRQTYPGVPASSGRAFVVYAEDEQLPTIAEIDPVTGVVLNSFDGPALPDGDVGPKGLAVGPDSLFFVEWSHPGVAVYELNLNTGKILDADVVDVGLVDGVAYLDGRLFLNGRDETYTPQIMVYDPATDTIVSSFPPPSTLSGITGADDLGVLFAIQNGSSIVALDPATGGLLSATDLDQQYSFLELAYADGELIARTHGSDTVGVRIAPVTGTVLGTFPLVGGEQVIGLGGDGVGADIPQPASRLFALVDDDDEYMAELDPVTGAVIRSLPLPQALWGHRAGLAFDGTSLFGVSADTESILQLDPDTGAVVDEDPIGLGFAEYEGAAALNGKVYIFEWDSGDIVEFDPVLDTITNTLDIDQLNNGMQLMGSLAAASNPGVLLSVNDWGEAVEIDPVTGLVTKLFDRIDGLVDGMTVLDGEIYCGDPFAGGIAVYSFDGERLRSVPFSDEFSALAGGSVAGGGPAGAHQVTLGPGESYEAADFGNQLLTGEIRGSKWLDSDGNGQWDATETALADWIVYLDENQNGQLDTRQLRLEPDDYPEQTQLNAVRADVTLTAIGTDVNEPDVEAVDTGSASTGTQVFGTPWTQEWHGEDVRLKIRFPELVMGVSIDFDGRPDSTGFLEVYDTSHDLLDTVTLSEKYEWQTLSVSHPGGLIAYAIAGASFDGYVRLDNLRFTVAGEPVTTTDAGGEYEFVGLPPGRHQVAEVVPRGWEQTHPDRATSTGRLFALRGEPGQTPAIYQVDPIDGSEINSFPAPAVFTAEGGPRSLAVGPHSLFYVDRASETDPHVLYELDLDTGEVVDADVVPVTPPATIFGAAFFDGQIYLTQAGSPPKMLVFDPAADVVVETLDLVQDFAGGLTGAADLGILFVTGSSDEIFAVNPADGQVVAQIDTSGVSNDYQGLAYVGGELIGINSDGVSASRIDPQTGQMIAPLPVAGSGPLISLGGDGVGAAIDTAQRLFAIAQGGDEIVELNPADGSEIRRFPAPESVSGSGGLTFDGESLFFITSGSRTLWQLNPYFGTVIDQFELERLDGVTGLAAVGEKIYLLDHDRWFGHILLEFDPTGRERLRAIEIGQFNNGMYLPDGLTGLTGLADPPALAAVDDNDYVVLIDPATGLITQVFEAGGAVLGALAAVDGQLYVGVDDNGPKIKVFSPGGVLQQTIDRPDLVAVLGGDDIPPCGPAHSILVQLASGGAADDVDFGNRHIPGEITGSKWHDFDADGQRDANEPPLADWDVFIDLNVNGRFDAGEPQTQTDQAGGYRFEDLPPGSYLVSELVPAHWEQTYPTRTGTDGRLFVLRGTDFETPTIEEVDPYTGAVINQFLAPEPLHWAAGVQGLGVGPNSLFYIDGYASDPHWLYELDPDTGNVIDAAYLYTDWDFSGLAYLNGLIYMPAQVGPRGIQVFDPGTDTYVDTIAQGTRFEMGLTGAADLGVLFGIDDSGLISKIDPVTGNVVEQFQPGFGPAPWALAYVRGELIAADSGTPPVAYRIDPETGEVLGSSDFAGTEPVIGLGGDGTTGGAVAETQRLFVWPDDQSFDIVELGPFSGAEINRFDAPPEFVNGASGLAFDGESLFVMDIGSHKVWQLDPATGAELDSDLLEDFAGNYEGLAALGDKVYALRESHNDIVVFDPQTDTVTDVLSMDDLNPGLFLRGGLAAAREPDVLLAVAAPPGGGFDTIVEIDPVSGLVTHSFTPDEVIRTGLAVTGGEIYARDFGQGGRVFVYDRDGNLRRSITLPYDVNELAGVDVHFEAAGHMVNVLSRQVVSDVDFGNRTVSAAPTDLDLSTTSVPEDQPAGTVVGTFTTSDPDVGDTFTYELVTGAGDTNNASFTIGVDQLKTDEVFDFQTQSTYSIRVRTTDSGGGWYERPFAITVTSVGFVVTDLAPDPSGFTAVFSRALDTTELNLYDVAAGVFGQPDVTLVGNNGGPVAGSLMFGTDRVTFIATGGPLPADAYTLTMRSGPDAFQDQAGELLDGDGDGTPDGDYAHIFSVAPEPVWVGVPDFPRGPGQSVRVPADGPGLPVMLFDNRTGDDNLKSLEVTLTYDPALLNISDAAPGPDAPAGAAFTADTLTPGVVTLSLSTAGTPFARGDLHLVTLTAAIPAGATYGTAGQLVLSDLVVTDTTGAPVSATPDNACHAVSYFGDATGNRDYSGLDAQRVARVAVGLDGGFEAFPQIDPVVIADVTLNGDLSGLDAQRIAQEAVGLAPDEIPPLPEPVQPQRMTQETPGARKLPMSAGPGFSTSPPAESDATRKSDQQAGLLPPDSGAFRCGASIRAELSEGTVNGPQLGAFSAIPSILAEFSRPFGNYEFIAMPASPAATRMDASRTIAPSLLPMPGRDLIADAVVQAAKLPATPPAWADLEDALEDDFEFDPHAFDLQAIDAAFADRRKPDF